MYAYDSTVYEVSCAQLETKARYRFRAAAIFVLYVLQEYCLKKNCLFFEDLLPTHTRKMVFAALVSFQPYKIAWLSC
jgi:hypothetical protein